MTKSTKGPGRPSRAGFLNTEKGNQSLLTQRRNILMKHPTPAENHVKALLDEIGDSFIVNKGFFTSYRFFIVDFYIKSRHRLCLEIDGGIHRERVMYDAQRDKYLTKTRRLRVVRITNETAMSLDAAGLIALMGPKSKAGCE